MQAGFGTTGWALTGGTTGKRVEAAFALLLVPSLWYLCSNPISPGLCGHSSSCSSGHPWKTAQEGGGAQDSEVRSVQALTCCEALNEAFHTEPLCHCPICQRGGYNCTTLQGYAEE